MRLKFGLGSSSDLAWSLVNLDFTYLIWRNFSKGVQVSKIWSSWVTKWIFESKEIENRITNWEVFTLNKKLRGSFKLLMSSNFEKQRHTSLINYLLSLRRIISRGSEGVFPKCSSIFNSCPTSLAKGWSEQSGLGPESWAIARAVKFFRSQQNL